MELFAGFLLGIVASVVAALVFDRVTSPKLTITLDSTPRADGAGATVEYHHLAVRNSPTRWGLPGRRPAWAAQATLEVFRRTGEPLTASPIRATWSSQPLPVSSFVIGNQLVQGVDRSKISSDRRTDIHSHLEERLTVALKYPGDADLFLYSNESLLYSRGCNPTWRLGNGTYRLRVTVWYERGQESADFELRNAGTTLADVSLREWNGHAAV